MAHGITDSDTMFSVVEKPWHGLDTVLNQAPTIEEAIKHAGLCWEVGLEPLFTSQGEEVSRQAVRRLDTKVLLGDVGPIWKPYQNDKAFNFFQPFVDSGIASLETAGSLFEGRKVFVLAKVNIPDSVIVEKSNDKIEAYILLSNSHDGGSIRVGFTPVRVICNNTLSMAHGSNASKLIRVKHSSNSETNMTNIRETMNLISQSFEATADQYRKLAAVEINQTDVNKYFTEVFNLKDEAEATRKQRTMEQLIELFETGRGNHLPGVAGTAWAAYNATTEYMQYYSGKSVENRFASLWLGQNENRSRQALEKALALV